MACFGVRLCLSSFTEPDDRRGCHHLDLPDSAPICGCERSVVLSDPGPGISGASAAGCIDTAGSANDVLLGRRGAAADTMDKGISGQRNTRGSLQQEHSSPGMHLLCAGQRRMWAGPQCYRRLELWVTPSLRLEMTVGRSSQHHSAVGSSDKKHLQPGTRPARQNYASSGVDSRYLF